jgi:hypothetical protein
MYEVYTMTVTVTHNQPTIIPIARLYDALGNAIATVNSGQIVSTLKSAAGVEQFGFATVVTPLSIGGFAIAGKTAVPTLSMTGGFDGVNQQMVGISGATHRELNIRHRQAGVPQFGFSANVPVQSLAATLASSQTGAMGGNILYGFNDSDARFDRIKTGRTGQNTAANGLMGIIASVMGVSAMDVLRNAGNHAIGKGLVISDYDVDGIPSKNDPLTNSKTTVVFEHHEIHEGDSFNVHVESGSLAAAATYSIAFKTENSTKRIHLLINYATKTGGKMSLYEGATWTTNTGTLATIYNKKRQSSMNSSSLLEDLTSTPTFAANDKVLIDPTIAALGTVIPWQDVAYGAVNRPATGGRATNERILKPDTTYVIQFVSGAASNQVFVELDWYEHTDSN